MAGVVTKGTEGSGGHNCVKLPTTYNVALIFLNVIFNCLNKQLLIFVVKTFSLQKANTLTIFFRCKAYLLIFVVKSKSSLLVVYNEKQTAIDDYFFRLLR